MSRDKKELKEGPDQEGMANWRWLGSSGGKSRNCSKQSLLCDLGPS